MNDRNSARLTTDAVSAVAPAAKRVDVCWTRQPMKRGEDGWFRRHRRCKAGALQIPHRREIDVPSASFQPDDVFGQA
jgi:hypothetical protein